MWIFDKHRSFDGEIPHFQEHLKETRFLKTFSPFIQSTVTSTESETGNENAILQTLAQKTGQKQSVEFTSVVITKHDALGLIVTSPVMRPTSENSSYKSRYFWLLRAFMGVVYMTRCLSRKDIAMAYLENIKRI